MQKELMKEKKKESRNSGVGKMLYKKGNVIMVRHLDLLWTTQTCSQDIKEFTDFSTFWICLGGHLILVTEQNVGIFSLGD